MKSHYKFMVFIALIIISILGMQRVLKQFLPDFKGIIEHEEIVNSQSFSIDRDIIVSLWKDYSKSLPKLTSTNNKDYRELEKELSSILESYTQSQPILRDNIFDAMQLRKDSGSTLYLKDYIFQTKNQKSYILNYICSFQEQQNLLYYHIQSKDQNVPTQQQKHEAIQYMNKVNTYGIENHDISNNTSTNPFVYIQTLLQKVIHFSQSKELLGLSITNDSLLSPHFYTMEYEDELLLVFIPNIVVDLKTHKKEKQNTSLILFYNILEERFSGFLLKTL